MSSDSKRDDAVFVTTRWTLVARARGETPEARAALGDLCTAYYAAVEAFIGRQAPGAETARDLTQEFFSRLLAGSGIRGAEPGRGRFRSYLLGAVKHFLQVERVRRLAAKRGAGAEHVPLEDPTETRPGLQVADPSGSSAEVEFDRQWAHALLARALDRLGREMNAEGKGRSFEVLKACLLGAGDPRPQADLAASLGMSEGALKVTVHRLRRRFREVVRAEIADTLSDPALVDEEMRHLLEALTR